MKLHLLVLGTIVLATACNSGPKAPKTENSNLADSLRLAGDTAGLAEYQAWKAQNELGKTEQQEEKASGTSAKKTAASQGSSGHSSGNGSGTANSTSTNEAQAKKGWSKTAKGAVIGGVVGAGTGAVVNKKNRAAGAVVGGVIGAGAGAIIGHEMDKKDGRH